MSQQSFAELGVSDQVVRALAAGSITEPFKIQSIVLPDALAGLDVLAKSPTGSGKTLAFALPIVERTVPSDARPSALILVPTRELAQQVADEFAPLAAAKGLKVGVAYGGVSIGAQAAGAKKAQILVATPGRLEDLANRRAVDLSQVRILVLDEADRMLDMGFKPQVDKLVRRMPKNRQTMFFSATLDGEVGDLAHSYTSSPSRFEAEMPPEREAGVIEHRFIAVTDSNKLETLVDHLQANDDGLTLVFVRTKRGADRLVSRLRRHNVNAVAMHGDMSQAARQRSLERFEKRQVSDPHRHRRRRARPRHRGRRARRELRPARRRQGLSPPHRPHRPRRQGRHRHHVRLARAARGDEPCSRPPRPQGPVRGIRHAERPPEDRLHEPQGSPL